MCQSKSYHTAQLAGKSSSAATPYREQAADVADVDGADVRLLAADFRAFECLLLV